MARTAIGWVMLGIGVVAVILSCLRAEQQLAAIGFRAMDDWLTYALAVERWLGGLPIYAPEQLSGPYQLRDTLRVGFTYPPATVPLLLPFAAGPAGAAAWLALNLGAFLLAVVAILRAELGVVRPLPLAVALLGLAAFPPFGNAVVSGNLNLGIAAALGWAWVATPRAVSVAAGVGAVMKLFPGLLSAWAARSGGWRELGVSAAVAVALALLSVPLVGMAAWGDFVIALANAQPECSAQSLSIACGLTEPIGPGPARLIGIGVSLGLLVVVLRARSPFVAFACLGAAMLAPVVDMHPHYWLLAWVVAFVGIVRAAGRFRARRMEGRR